MVCVLIPQAAYSAHGISKQNLETIVHFQEEFKEVSEGEDNT